MTNSVHDAREALGARLRELRRKAGLTNRHLAHLSGWHESKVSKIEFGRINPSDEDIRAYCRHCDADEQLPDLLATLHDIDVAYLEWRKILGAGTRRRQHAAVKMAEESEILRIFQPNIVPGILQTAEYAEQVLRKYIDFFRVPDDLDAGVAKRLERQQLLYKGSRRFHILVAEQALSTTVGDDSVMIGQLDRLLAIIGLPRVLLGVIPADAELPMQVTNFVMFDERMVLVESVTAELTITPPREVAIYGRMFGELAALSVTGDGARRLIRAALERRQARPEAK
ncbi:Helix-turn-helix domain-containing protein [Nocardia amikacinitolerans]|uniref:Helix-turn-helix domain-containing protein n=1 Tax=Nocardia amikacinitolerans TaxID=756689 RepID=A0A285KQ79_9NOCA|nr:helix-turn-helix transcriptional regulator [Nocardia amikacinitolerans]MCP2275498.1 Helix-turn-helix domain-containing protein [Nocardia amikacinitolerans]MCP2293758.1 Helix-turn-helix domain-containing protein [Nocardia amikacinitolerans]SNY74789.1 Helix-turn-helix domain-containing protein [Nocardia amikacinitolerans]